MLDIKFIRENPELCREAAKNKNKKVDFDKILILDRERKKLIGQIDEKRAERNKIAKREAGSVKREVEEGRKLKEEVQKLEEELRTVEKEFFELMLTVPNVPDKSVPVGKDASGNQEVKKWGEMKPASGWDFTPLDHISLMLKHDLVDFERGVKVGGFRTYFLKNEAAMLEMAVLTYTLQKLVKKGYIPLIAPSLVKEFTLLGNGQFPWGREEVYHLEKDDVYLAGTAEVPVTAYFAGEALLEKDLPKKFVAFSPCFRREAGSYGKDTKGLYRLHQFNKIEQVIITSNNDQQSIALHEELLQNAESVLQDLKLSYRVMLMCTGDMGEPQVKKYDIETWMPSRQAYGETMSNSFMGEFQARRLNIRYRTREGVVKYAHTLNNTAVASPRILIAILENYQQSDGSILIPEVLRNFVGKDKICLR
ncbi:serine--tRNA ligase [Candidatus Gottesmanbacteria bacterium RIFCSPHIGHO2_02_FULL_40_13]|uniref:Serine--tRNA ligase n=1 Tax=Candidatus Gottesmanbacteria bacterium RIFCSPHIGHO2_02_FULL_40_13 TaxID=1798384 RepID=A0A1F6A8A9_9BACT|nr:MAG: serine--tRNA ligase [Candidatus Gottesmanbacteria bacterium RIFCSPHIGHO2_02_FULL_40_13]